MGPINLEVAPAVGTISADSVTLTNGTATETFTGIDPGVATVTATFAPLDVSGTVDISVQCEAGPELLNLARKAYEEAIQNFHFGSTITVTVDKTVVHESTCEEQPLVSGTTEYKETSCTALKKMNATTEYRFTTPAKPSPLTCEEILICSMVPDESERSMCVTVC